MIHVSQGHHRGIGLEVFLKSFLLLPKKYQKYFTLHCNTETLLFYLKQLKYDFTLKQGQVHYSGSEIFLVQTDDNVLPQSTESLNSALKIITSNDVLLTLPTSKDQLILAGKQTFGHTDFLQKYYSLDTVSMNFQSHDEHILLITDHIPLSTVSEVISSELIIKKLDTVLKEYQYQTVSLSGINPHSGENGLLGNEDIEITNAILELKRKYPSIKFNGPIPGDTLMIEPSSPDHLLVFMYHDQGLGIFKTKNKVVGINRTFGLPIKRLSVDHGTAFDKLFTDTADYYGCYYVMMESLRLTIK